MTSKQIETVAPHELSTNAWLKMIALHLSILIESLSAPIPEVPPTPVKRGPGRPRKNP